MRIISRRGNLTGRIPALENSPAYVQAALDAGFEVAVDVEVDAHGIWLVGQHMRHPVDLGFIDRDRLWVMGSDELPFSTNRIVWPAPLDPATLESICIMTSDECEHDDDVPTALARAIELPAASAALTICSDHTYPAPMTPPASLRVALLHPDVDNILPFAALYLLTHPTHSVHIASIEDRNLVDGDSAYDVVCVKLRIGNLPEFENLLPPKDDPRPRVLVPSRNRSGGVNLDIAVGTVDSIRLYCCATVAPQMSPSQSLLGHLRAAGVTVEEFDEPQPDLRVEPG